MPPKILLIGCGKFGKNYLRLLKKFHKEKKIIFEGVVTSGIKTSQGIAIKEKVKSYYQLSGILLKGIEGIMIATPASTHYDLAKKCLGYADVYSEKPLALSAKQIMELIIKAKEKNRVLMVGHIMRFSGIIVKIKEILKEKKPKTINIRFLGGIPPKDCGALHDFMHVFDVLDYLLNETPEKAVCIKAIKDVDTGFERYVKTELYYSKTKALIEVGWGDNIKERSILINAEGKTIKSNGKELFIDNKKIRFQTKEPLLAEIERFIEIISGSKAYYPDAELALKIENIIKKIRVSMRQANLK